MLTLPSVDIFSISQQLKLKLPSSLGEGYIKLMLRASAGSLVQMKKDLQHDFSTFLSAPAAAPSASCDIACTTSSW
jgi:N-methylhydantoinase A/oxoprolinase/acetone carboxylase beta subunit